MLINLTFPRCSLQMQTEHSQSSLGLALSAAGPVGPSEERANLLRSLYEQRLRNVVGQLKDTMAHMRGDAATQALLADSSTSEFAAVRALHQTLSQNTKP